MKKKRGLNIKLKLSNRWLYTLIVIGILSIICIGVYAYNSGLEPSVMGHTWDEMICDGNLCINDGKVGIGTTNPGTIVSNSKLDVVGGHIVVSNNYGFLSYNNAGDGWGAGIDTTIDDKLNLLAGGGARVTIAANGYVGIGTTSPSAKLDVNGGIESSSLVVSGGINTATLDASGTITGDFLKADGSSVTADTLCSSSEWGEIKRCTRYISSSLTNKLLCFCGYSGDGWKWRELP